MSEKQRLAVRMFHENIQKTQMGKDLRQCASEWMKAHGAYYYKMRKDRKKEEQKMKPVIIGLCGRGGSGKSTFAEMVVKKSKYIFMQVNFKDALVELAKYIGWNGIKDDKGRKFLQTLATDAIRNCIDPEYWTKRWVERVNERVMYGNVSIVVDDVRFENEVRTIVNFAKHNNFESYIIKLVTKDQKEVMTEEAKAHVSEAGIDEWMVDATIEMEYGLDHVSNAVEVFLQSIGFIERNSNAEYHRQHSAGEDI
jgi:dephospho-CoA kinase